MADSDCFTIGSAGLTKMPKIGLGTWQITDKNTLFDTIDAALDCGYRLIDTATVYRNEQHIGEILEQLLPKYGLKRQDVFITSKLAPADQGFESARAALRTSLQKLRVDYLDLYLIHWPGASKTPPTDVANKTRRMESWRALQQLKEEGLVREIGVSNFTVRHLEELLPTASCLPAVNQCEYHPHYANRALVDYCTAKQIHFQAYSSFGSAAYKHRLLEDNAVVAAAAAHKCTAAQLLLAWSLCQDISVLPRSSKPANVRTNFESRRIKLSPQQIEHLIPSDKNKYCWDPTEIM